MIKHTKEELIQFQSLPLEIKIRMTEERIRGWVRTFGEDGVYISFSGGKDSTVLMDIIRNRMKYEIPAVFVDTGLEYPEIREFVKTFENIIWLKPKMNFKEVIEKYGYPFIGKEISDTIYYARHSNGKYATTRMQRLNGTLLDSDGKRSKYNCSKWKFMLEAPFEVSDHCCSIFKKNPTKSYEKHTGRVPILGQMAEESRKRTQGWFKTGCNAFEAKRPQSNPMAFWTEQDILQYIKKYQIKICPVYGDVIEEDSKLKTTGCDRTGCMFCGYGCHLEKPGDGRFERMKKTHPQIYDYIMRPTEQGGSKL